MVSSESSDSVRLGDAAREVVRAALDQARDRWPSVPFADEVMERHVARVCGDDPRPEQLEVLALIDVALAASCAAGEPEAIKVFEREIIRPAGQKIRSMAPTAELAAELTQELRVRLLVAREGQWSRIARFAGRGSLVGWAKVAGARLAINRLTATRPDVDGDDMSWADAVALVDGLTPEDELVRERYLDPLCQAYRDAAASLSQRDRSLLYLSLKHQTSVDQLGTMFGVHRSTAARWVGAAKKVFLQRARELATQRLDVGFDEYESLRRLLHSQLVLSFGAFEPEVDATHT